MVLEVSVPDLVIDRERLPLLLGKTTSLGEQCNLSDLERLYSLLAQRIYSHRLSYDRTRLLEVSTFLTSTWQ